MLAVARPFFSDSGLAREHQVVFDRRSYLVTLCVVTVGVLVFEDHATALWAAACIAMTMTASAALPAAFDGLFALVGEFSVQNLIGCTVGSCTLVVFCDVLARDHAMGSVGITPGSAALRRDTDRSLCKARPRIIDGAARCVSLTLRARDLLRGGHVLGLRRLLDDQSYEVDAGKGPHIASKAEAEATPRVDVGEVSMTLVSPGERQNKPASFQVFARVDGKTLVVQVWEDMLVSELRALIACRLHASPDQCYVTKGGKLLRLLLSVHEVGLVKGSTVQLHARGVGGAIPGEW